MFADTMPSGGSTGSIGSYSEQFGIPLGGSGAYGPSSTDPMQRLIFMGWEYANRQQFEAQEGQRPRTETLGQLVADFERSSKEDQQHMAALLALSGYAGSIKLSDVDEWVQEASYPMVLDAYKGFLDDLANRYASGQAVSSDDLFKSAIGYRFKSAGVEWDGKLDGIDVDALADTLGGGTDQSGTHTTTSTSKTVDFLDPQDAKALVRGTLQNELGRDPTSAEYEDFLSMLQAAQAADPNVTKTTQTYTTDAEGNVVDQTSNSTTRQGMSSAGLGQLATEQAQSQPDWAEWQAMGTYFPALLQALGSTVPGV